MNFLLSLKVSASGLEAQRKRINTIASNLANIETTRTETGEPYRRKMIVMRSESEHRFDETLGSYMEGVRVDGIVKDNSPFRKVFNPGHPDADKEGYLLKPNIDLIVETVNMLMARRAFEANISAIKTTRQMALKALEIGK